jgi:hypothetical protein
VGGFLVPTHDIEAVGRNVNAVVEAAAVDDLLDTAREQLLIELRTTCDVDLDVIPGPFS